MKIWNNSVPPSTVEPISSCQQSEHGPSTVNTSILVKQDHSNKSRQPNSVKSNDKNKTRASQGVDRDVDVSLEKLEPEPRLELLVSNAARVSQEIEKAIQELKQTKSQSANVESSDNKITSSRDELTVPNNKTIFLNKSDEGKSFLEFD